MRSTRLTTALAGLLVAAALAAPAAHAMPIDPVAPAVTREGSDVPPPPSSIAASAKDQYEVLRMPVGSTEVADDPSSPSGFDWMSAAIGAVAAAGVALVAVAAMTTRRRTVLG